MDKVSLRKHYISLRSRIGDAEARGWSSEMATDLRRRLRSANFQGTLFLYSPIQGEPDLLGFMKQERVQIALPAVSGGGGMSFYFWVPGDPLRAGPFGILEPANRDLAAIPRRGDVAVVPALSVDSYGNRLGYGGGYYDRWLAEYRDRLSFVAAAVYPNCVSSIPLPSEPLDQRVDFVLASH